MKIALDPYRFGSRLGFGDGDRNIMTSCVFAWEDRAEDSTRFMRETIDKYVSAW